MIEIFPDKNKLIKLILFNFKKKIDGLIISNPNNPNGQTFTNSELKFIYEYCKKNKVILISDEIYHGIEYGKRIKSMLNYGISNSNK